MRLRLVSKKNKTHYVVGLCDMFSDYTIVDWILLVLGIMGASYALACLIFKAWFTAKAKHLKEIFNGKFNSPGDGT